MGKTYRKEIRKNHQKKHRSKGLENNVIDFLKFKETKEAKAIEKLLKEEREHQKKVA